MLDFNGAEAAILTTLTTLYLFNCHTKLLPLVFTYPLTYLFECFIKT